MKPNLLKHAARGFTLAFLLTGLPAFGQVILTSNWNGPAVPIPDNNPAGVAVNFNLSNPATVIENVSITMNIAGGYNGDLYAYLSHGSGFAVLLNRVGVSAANGAGYNNTGFAATFSGSAAADIHQYQAQSPIYNGNGQLTGTWAADGRSLDPASTGSAFDAAARNATLTNFNAKDPNGVWTLFIADRAFGEVATLNSFSVEVTAVPEPAQTGLAMAGILGLTAMFLKRRSIGAQSLHTKS